MRKMSHASEGLVLDGSPPMATCSSPCLGKHVTNGGLAYMKRKSRCCHLIFSSSAQVEWPRKQCPVNVSGSGVPSCYLRSHCSHAHRDGNNDTSLEETFRDTLVQGNTAQEWQEQALKARSLAPGILHLTSASMQKWLRKKMITYILTHISPPKTRNKWAVVPGKYN